MRTVCGAPCVMINLGTKRLESSVVSSGTIPGKLPFYFHFFRIGIATEDWESRRGCSVCVLGGGEGVESKLRRSISI